MTKNNNEVMDIEKISKEINSPALKEIARAIVSTVNAHESKKIKLDDARLKISGCKHLLQVMALEAMKERMNDPNGPFITHSR